MKKKRCQLFKRVRIIKRIINYMINMFEKEKRKELGMGGISGGFWDLMDDRG